MGNVKQYVEEAVEAYVACLLWTGQDWREVCDDDDDTCAYDHKFCEANPTPLGDTFGPEDVHKDAMSTIRGDVEAFLDLAWSEVEHSQALSAHSMGHNFALTRNGHGAGFWDLGLGAMGAELATWSHTFGEQDLYVGDDLQLHIS